MKPVLSFDKEYAGSAVVDFASASGDFNQIHLDPSYARRTVAGGQVVHGMLIVIDSLNECASQLLRVKSLKAVFKSFLLVDSKVNVTLHKERNHFKLIGVCSGRQVFSLDINGEVPQTHDCGGVGDMAQLISGPRASPEKLKGEFAQTVGAEYCYHLDDFKGFSEKWAALHNVIGPANIAALLAITNFIGMISPGRNSVFSSFELVLGEQNTERQYFSIYSYDERIRLFQYKLAGACSGLVTAFNRPHIETELNIDKCLALVKPKEFSGTRALVIGGSRGIGAEFVKLLALGGARVDFTYRVGVDEASSLVSHLNARSTSQVEAYRFDVLEDDLGSLLSPEPYDLVLYLATPKIRQSAPGKYDKQLFEEYVSYYVEGFERVYQFLERGVGKEMRCLFAPSTTFLETKPCEFAEYITAKFLFELLVEAKKKLVGRQIKVWYERLPQLRTDQTASLVNRHSRLASPAHFAYGVVKLMLEKVEAYK